MLSYKRSHRDLFTCLFICLLFVYLCHLGKGVKMGLMVYITVPFLEITWEGLEMARGREWSVITLSSYLSS